MPLKRDESDTPRKDEAFIQVDADGKKGAASAAPGRRSRVIAAVAAAACMALIVVSLGFVHPSESGAWSVSWLFQTTDMAGVSVTANGGSKGSGDAKGTSSAEDSDKEGSDKSSDAKDESKSKDGTKSKSDSKSKDGSKTKDASKSKDDTKSAGDGKSGSDSHQDSGATSGSSSSSSSSSTDSGQQSQGATSGSGTSQSGGSSAGGAPNDGLVTVTVSVTSSAVGNPVSAGGTYTFNRGATVYDALCALGLSVNAHGSAYGTYVAAIGGLAEKEHGGTSGWMYSVNGVTPNVACSAYTLSDGDNIVWYYVTG